MGTGQPIKIPPGNARGRWNDRRFGAEQGLHCGQFTIDLVRLQRDEHIILRPKFRRVIGGAHGHGEIIFRRYDADAVTLHRLQMWASGNQGDVDPAARQMAANVATDGTCAVDADLHCIAVIKARIAAICLSSGPIPRPEV